MKYKWVSFGEDYNPVVAFIAPSNGIEGEAGQKLISQKIAVLIAKGFCVKIPQYENGSLVIEPEIIRQSSERLRPTVSPAVSEETGANQVIESIQNGWNMMPLMGGDGFENKIPLILKHFEEHPQDRDPNVKIFGFSNSTYATILASRGICSFISTPFVNVFNLARSDPEHFLAAAQELEKLLKGQETTTYPRRVIYNPDGKLSEITQTFNYPLNLGTLDSETKKPRLQIPSDQAWSISVEGSLQMTLGPFVNYSFCLNKFLQQHQDHLPSFIEIGNLATRLDGNRGYANLIHDEATGMILLNDYNLDKIYANKGSLEEDLRAAALAKSGLDPSEKRQLRLLRLIPDEIFDKVSGNSPLTKEDIATVIQSQNAIISEVMNEISKTAQNFRIPLIQNTRNGHCANMSIVNGGQNQVELQGDQIFLSMPQQMRGNVEVLSGESLANSSSLPTQRINF